MKEGLLWQDAEGTLEERVARAAAAYAEKTGLQADTCFVHESEVTGEVEIGRVTVKSWRYTQPGYLWIGVADEGR